VKKHRLPTTDIPASDIPVVTPGPRPDTMKETEALFPPEDTDKNQGITLASAITIATGDYTNSVQYVNSTGYTYQLRDLNLRAVYDEYQISGEDETRLIKGFQSLVVVLAQAVKDIGLVEIQLNHK